MHRVVELRHDGFQVRSGLFQISQLLGQERVPRFQCLELFQSERVHPTQLVESSLGLGEPRLLIAAHKRRRLPTLLGAIRGDHLLGRVFLEKSILFQTQFFSGSLEERGALEFFLIHLHLQRVHRVGNGRQALPHRGLTVPKRQELLV